MGEDYLHNIGGFPSSSNVVWEYDDDEDSLRSGGYESNQKESEPINDEDIEWMDEEVDERSDYQEEKNLKRLVLITKV